MPVHPLAGKSAPRSMLVNVARLVGDYYVKRPDIENPAERVAFGTSGHRGSSFRNSYNEAHILAITQAICDYRKAHRNHGPLFLGMDTHALSEPSHATALEVLAANDVNVLIHRDLGYTPTPVISHAILKYNRGRESGLADGIVITPSHNPPEDGGFKYNPPHGGPADEEVTRWVEARANDLLKGDNREVRRIPYERALRTGTTHEHDYVKPYVEDLKEVIEMEAIRSAGLKIGVDPMGGSTLPFWEPIAQTYGLNMKVVNPLADPTFGFMTLDRDGQIRMDCSSPHAMARLVGLKDEFDLAFGNDPDGDRHGIVTRGAGVMNPNHYLSAAAWYLFNNRLEWRSEVAVGKTFVTSSMIDRIAEFLGRKLYEVPVGFKWFVQPLLEGSCGFAGEESAGASFLRRDGTVWTTDKDGMILNLLAVEITAKTGSDPGEQYRRITENLGDPVYERTDVPATPEEKAVLRQISPRQIAAATLAGDPILSKLIEAPEGNAPLGGVKVVTENGWFAVRPSGTEDVYKIYAESFKGREHLVRIQEEAKSMVETLLKSARPTSASDARR